MVARQRAVASRLTQGPETSETKSTEVPTYGGSTEVAFVTFAAADQAEPVNVEKRNWVLSSHSSSVEGPAVGATSAGEIK